ncbi:MAG: hypothetical protein ACO1OX_15860 [Novosphingobium sp.]
MAASRFDEIVDRFQKKFIEILLTATAAMQSSLLKLARIAGKLSGNFIKIFVLFFTPIISLLGVLLCFITTSLTLAAISILVVGILGVAIFQAVREVNEGGAVEQSIAGLGHAKSDNPDLLRRLFPWIPEGYREYSISTKAFAIVLYATLMVLAIANYFTPDASNLFNNFVFHALGIIYHFIVDVLIFSPITYFFDSIASFFSWTPEGPEGFKVQYIYMAFVGIAGLIGTAYMIFEISDFKKKLK